MCKLIISIMTESGRLTWSPLRNNNHLIAWYISSYFGIMMQAKQRDTSKKLAHDHIQKPKTTHSGRFRDTLWSKTWCNNRWVKLSQCIPWDELASGYYQNLSSTHGRTVKDAHLVVGAVIIKHKLCRFNKCQPTFFKKLYWLLSKSQAVLCPWLFLLFILCFVSQIYKTLESMKISMNQTIFLFPASWPLHVAAKLASG